MATKFQEQFVFHLTGKRHSEELEPIDAVNLRPALLAGFRDLTRLRYDFPVVLVEGGAEGGPVQSLSSVVDNLLKQVAPRGIEGERLRKHVLKLEREIRALVAQGETGPLSGLWSLATAKFASEADETPGKVLAHTGAALEVDGEVLDCTRDMPALLLRHLWQAAQAQKARKFHAEGGALAVKLSDILRAAFVRSDAGRRAESLKASVGGPHQDIFDFTAMSKLLRKAAQDDDLPVARRKRIEWALAVLRSQQFFAPPEAARSSPTTGHHAFCFDDCASAVAAFRKRLTESVELVKAISIAELEADGRYDEAKHDPLFAEFDSSSLGPADMVAFPDYLVCIAAGRTDAPENAMLMEVLSSGLPIKVLVQTEEVLEASSVGDGQIVFGVRGAQLASTALGLDNVFVLQSSSSNLYQFRERIQSGVGYNGPALFSVFSGSAAPASLLPPYLAAAAAMQARAFPAFSCDPAAGSDWASRFSIDDNPHAGEDWPVDHFAYSDEELQRVSEQLAFTIVDFAATDRRHARYFARVPRSHWNANMVTVEQWLSLGEMEREGKVPYVLAVDENDVLQRLVVDARLMQAARRCREMWHRLQELGGIHNSHAERLLAREKIAWEERKQSEFANLKAEATSAAAATTAVPAASAVSPAASAAASAEAAPAERPSEEAYIETIRCSSCNECTQINDRMFAYDANQQAYIADLGAGSYRELVEAAENCQLSIIHPGKPHNPDEPDLEELIKRAEPFA
ncbi:MAG: hypothetical protein HY017_00450 [Betaproteobacteria bacterium]|nr:hypothetical protein [Betaproteobacteria bacterium]